MKSQHEHLDEMRQLALKIAERLYRAMQKTEERLPIGSELQAIRDLSLSLVVTGREHELFYGIGGPEPTGIVNAAGITVRQDPGMPSDRVDFVQDGKIVGRITNIGEDA